MSQSLQVCCSIAGKEQQTLDDRAWMMGSKSYAVQQGTHKRPCGVSVSPALLIAIQTAMFKSSSSKPQCLRADHPNCTVLRAGHPNRSVLEKDHLNCNALRAGHTNRSVLEQIIQTAMFYSRYRLFSSKLQCCRAGRMAGTPFDILMQGSLLQPQQAHPLPDLLPNRFLGPPLWQQ